MRNKRIFRTVLFFSVLIHVCLFAGCQTTRLPKAVRSADNSSLLLHVSEDPSSLMWNGGRVGNGEIYSRLKSSPNQTSDPASLQMRAELLLVGRMTRPAADQARTILRRDLHNVRALKTLIKTALIDRKPHEVIALCQMAQEHSPQDAELFSLEGLAHYQLENFVTAKILWNRALARDPVHIPTLMNMGVLLFNNGHFKRAGANFDKVLAVQGEHADALLGRALVRSAEGNSEEAVAALEELMKNHGDNAFVLAQLAQISRDHLKDYKRAARYVERTLGLQNNDRRTLEQAISMKQELKRLMENNDKNYSDETLRRMAEHSSTSSNSAENEMSASQKDIPNSDLQRLEETIK
jgi:tetratricopeptide (TPR) repeat protein